MSWLYAGQEQREQRPIVLNEVANDKRITREDYFGTMNAPNPYPAGLEIPDSSQVKQVQIYGPLKNPGVYGSGLSFAEELAQTKFYDASIHSLQLNQDGNPYNDQYIFDYSIYPEYMGKPMNNGAMVGGQLEGGEDTDDEDLPEQDERAVKFQDEEDSGEDIDDYELAKPKKLEDSILQYLLIIYQNMRLLIFVNYLRNGVTHM